MAQLYDSEKVRQAASAVRELSEPLSDGTTRTYSGASENIALLRGRAVDALDEGLAQATRDIRRICANLDALSASLERYAGELEEVDERLSAEMQG